KIRNIGEIQGYAESCGLMAASAVDTYRLIFGYNPKLDVIEEEVPPEPDDNIIKDIDFKKLYEEEEDETIRSMHAYFSGKTPTRQNDKTGVFEGKNLIFITAESFSDFAIDEKYTPTLYKLQKEGYSFNNFYNPIWGVSTIDGEYVNLQGLVPKPGVWSMKKSSNNYLPFTLGNSFLREGYVSKAYHNHSVTYYNRDVSHPNLGYEFKGQGREYRFANTWPESDIEMVDKTTEDYLTPGADGTIAPFNVYYLTVSGHMNYNFYGNEMAMKNRHLVEDMNKSDACRAYMATQIEFDRSMELLLERLDAAGVLEDTVIAIAADHYPYGLTDDEISEFRGHDIDTTYELFRNTFILWTPGMEGESVDKLCCSMDILPTLLNMFGIEYDSRLLMGRDIFSPEEGLVVLKDKNWISERGTREELLVSDEIYVEEMDKEVQDMFNYSTLVLDHDYYSYLKEYIE
ncbi:MAG: LTA synthase family protein, partial [Firmicutes bacterium]|nr:LTA synthase family protein [Bacillota bacterium]